MLGLVVAVIIVGMPAWAQDDMIDADAPVEEVDVGISNEVDGFPVMLEDRIIFQVREGVDGVATAEERAGIIEQRIEAIAETPEITADDIRTETKKQQSIVFAGDTVLLTISETDAEAYGQAHPELARIAAGLIRDDLTEYRRVRSVRHRVFSIAATLISTVALLLFLRGLFLVASKLLIRIRALRRAGSLQLYFQSFPLLGSGATGYLLSNLVRLGRAALVLLALYLYLPFVLSLFPATDALGDSILRDIAFRINALVQAFVSYLPNLAMLAVIALIAYYAIQFAEQVIIELGRPGVYPWFYEEWIQPTNRLAMFLIIAIALVEFGANQATI
ncbi:MAG: hypothetical protein AAGH67_18790 [Cyanobacteria bacterium P01_H01_bin.162]